MVSRLARICMQGLFLYLLLSWITYPFAETTSRGTLLILGDSLSAAYGISPSKGWVALLEERLKQQGYDYTIINSSISGDTTGNGLTRLQTFLQGQQHPEIIIIELGSNDGLRGLSIPEIKKNLTDMVVLAKQFHSKVLLLGFLMPPNYGTVYRDQFEKIYQDIALEQGVPLVPFFLANVALDPNLTLNDNLHPNEKAQPILLDNVWKYLEPLLKK